jgi:hypothetical protein
VNALAIRLAVQAGQTEKQNKAKQIHARACGSTDQTTPSNAAMHARKADAAIPVTWQSISCEMSTSPPRRDRRNRWPSWSVPSQSIELPFTSKPSAPSAPRRNRKCRWLPSPLGLSSTAQSLYVLSSRKKGTALSTPMVNPSTGRKTATSKWTDQAWVFTTSNPKSGC